MNVLFYCRAMEDLARKALHLAGGPSLRSSLRLGSINWDKFADGFPNLFINNIEEDAEGNDVAFLASFSSPSEIFQQLSVIYALPRYGAKSFKIILPFFPTGTMERVEKEGEVATAMTLARMFSAVECKEAELHIFDIHDKRERFYFRHPIVPKFKSAVSYVKRLIPDNKSICFPDEGARKRFGSDFVGWHQILCHKERLGHARKVKIIEGDPMNKDIVIVDDLVMTGGTLLECALELEFRGARSVSAYATHAVFPNKSYFNMRAFPFANFWVTNSCPETVKGLADCGTKFEVLSLAPLIAKLFSK